MKTSKFFLTTLFAAAAMTASAFAADYTVANGAIKETGGNKVASDGASGAMINGEVNTAGVVAAAGDNFTFDNVTGYLPGWNNGGTFAGNVVLTGGGLNINNGAGVSYTFFSGSVSGDGDFSVNANNNPAKGEDFIFTGDLTAFTGNFSRPVAGFAANDVNAYNTLTGILQFGGTVSSNAAGAGTAYAASATAGADGVVHNVSGSGKIVSTSVVRYNYTGSANAGVSVISRCNPSRRGCPCRCRCGSTCS